MEHVRKVFMYNKEQDHDIDKWFENLPAREHSKYVRAAIRLLMAQEEEKAEAIEDKTELSSIKKELHEIKQMLLSKNNSTVSVPTVEKEEKAEVVANTEFVTTPIKSEKDDYIDATSILSQLGK